MSDIERRESGLPEAHAAQNNEKLPSDAPAPVTAGYAPAPPVVEPCKPLTFTVQERLMIIPVLAAGLMLSTSFLMQVEAPRLGLLLIYIVSGGAFLWYHGRPSELNRVGLVTLAAGLVMALSLTLNANSSLYAVNVPVIVGLLCSGFLLSTGTGSMDWKRPRTIAAGIFYTIGLFCVNADKLFRAVGSSGKNKTVWKVLLGLLIATPVVLIVTGLLSSADQQFRSIAGRVFELTPSMSRIVVRFFWGVPAAAALYSLLYGVKRKRALKSVPFTGDGAIKQGDGVILTVVLSMLCVVYGVFMYVQFAYLFSRILPPGISYAEYARSGFFELAFVTFINLCLVLLSVTYTRTDAGVYKLLRILNLLILSLTLVILTSAVYRMCMYVDVYGLTTLRFFVLWGELVMLICIALTGVKALKPDFKAFPYMACATLALYLALNLCNRDAVIANYNVDLYLKGSNGIDIEYLLTELSPDALPALERLPGDIAYTVNEGYLAGTNRRISPDGLRSQAQTQASGLWSWNLTAWRVK